MAGRVVTDEPEDGLSHPSVRLSVLSTAPRSAMRISIRIAYTL
jgi:hypothetical protein